MARRRRCGFCGTSGHNRRKCPEIKKQIAENPTGYYARQEEKAQEHRIRNPRKCSWCNESGHNKTTCSTLKNQLNEHGVQSRAWNHRFFKLCKEAGLGIGSLVKLEVGPDSSEWNRGYNQERLNKSGHHGIVVGFNEDVLNPHLNNRNALPLKIRYSGGRVGNCALPHLFSDLGKYPGNSSDLVTHLVGKIDSTNIASSFTFQFLDGTTGARQILQLDRK